MKKTFATLLAVIAACSLSFARTFDGETKLYLDAGVVEWWTNDGCTQRAVLNNTTSVIGVVEDGKIYAFTIPAGEYSTIRFERAETAESVAWNATGEINIPDEGDYVTAFSEGSATATWETYVPVAHTYDTYHIYVTNNTTWTAFYLYAWGNPNEPYGAWGGQSGTEFEFTVMDNTVDLHLIFHQDDGEANRALFDITEPRDYNLIVADDGVTEDATTAVNNISGDAKKAVKSFRNGMLVIEKNGKFYNALGAEIK